MKSVFISHSRSDTDMVNLVAEMLNREGIEVSRADYLSQGSDWQAEIQSAIRRCGILIAFIDELTPNVMLELGYALGAAKQVLLVGGPDARIPFDVASLPVIRLDRYDNRSLFAIMDKIRSAAHVEATPVQEFDVARDHLEHMLHDSSYLEQVAPQEFESSVRTFLQELELDAEQMPMAHDGGYDILVRDPHARLHILVEVKKYTQNSKVGVAVVRQLLGATMVQRASGAILVTSSDFSASARSFAERSPVPILLMTLAELAASTRESITAACS